jgi:hypothetical protein
MLFVFSVVDWTVAVFIVIQGHQEMKLEIVSNSNIVLLLCVCVYSVPAFGRPANMAFVLFTS